VPDKARERVVILQDLLVVKEIEKVLQTKFKEGEEFRCCWYEIDNNHISEISIQGEMSSDTNFSWLVTLLIKLKHLARLDLSISNLCDISQLRKLTQLKVLEIRGTKVNDITPIQYLQKLTTVILVNNPIKDVAPIRKLRKLTHLCLSRLQVDSVQVQLVENLVHLT